MTVTHHMHTIKLTIGNSELNINAKTRRKAKRFSEIDFNAIIVKLLHLWEWAAGDLFAVFTYRLIKKRKKVWYTMFMYVQI